MTPVEHQWFLAKYVADDMRGETRNVGVVLRPANAQARVQILDPVPFLRPEHAAEWKGWRDYWGEKVWKEHGLVKPFYWIAKRRPDLSPHFYWELAGARMATAVDFDQMFELLVKPENR